MRRRMKALVTGGAGFIGSNLVDALLARGDEVTVLDDISTGKRENLEQALANGAQLEEVDIRDAGAVSLLVGRTKPDVIFHLAAQIDVRKSVADPAHDARMNVEGTINVLSAAQAHGVPRVVNTSTGGAIYGEGQQLPARRRTTRAPRRRPTASRSGAPSSTARSSLACTASPRSRSATATSTARARTRSARPGVIAIFCGKVLEGGRATIFGDGKQTRDYVYVDDVVDANMRAAESEVTGPINIGLGRAEERARHRRGPECARRQRLPARACAGASWRDPAHRARPLARA